MNRAEEGIPHGRFFPGIILFVVAYMLLTIFRECAKIFGRSLESRHGYETRRRDHARRRKFRFPLSWLSLWEAL